MLCISCDHSCLVSNSVPVKTNTLIFYSLSTNLPYPALLLYAFCFRAQLLPQEAAALEAESTRCSNCFYLTSHLGWSESINTALEGLLQVSADMCAASESLLSSVEHLDRGNCAVQTYWLIGPC